MNDLLTLIPAPGCQADQRCDRAPCFQAKLHATAGTTRVTRDAEICACHLGGTVQALAAWARHQHLTGTVTVLAIDPAGHVAGDRPAGSHHMPRGFAFGTIALGPHAIGHSPTRAVTSRQ
jgi:hypothetical protein